MAVVVHLNGWERFPPGPKARLRRAVQSLLAEAKVRRGEVGITLGSDQLLRSLHRRSAGQDRVSDVLSFDLTEPGERRRGELWGDIYIARRRAVAQARAHGVPPNQELLRLALHGLLHLMGFDDRTPRARRRMWEVQERLVARWGPPSRRDT